MPEWKPSPTEILNVDGGSGNSSTQPRKVETDAGWAYLKLPSSCEGPDALVCELIGTRAAEWLAVPTFDYAVHNVDDRPELVKGCAFLTRLEPGKIWDEEHAGILHGQKDETAFLGETSRAIVEVSNKADIAGLIVLDTWLLNIDRYHAQSGEKRDMTWRNYRNVFLSDNDPGKGTTIKAFDHTHCFFRHVGETLTTKIATVERIEDPHLYGHFLEFKTHFTPETLGAYTTRLSKFTQEDAEALFKDLPVDWGLKSDVKTALIKFLTDRAAYLTTTLVSRLRRESWLDS
jgi:sarcosine oxidase delta subunit